MRPFFFTRFKIFLKMVKHFVQQFVANFLMGGFGLWFKVFINKDTLEERD